MNEPDRILLAHGGGGELTRQLVTGHILPRLANPALSPLTDGAILPPSSGRLVTTTDASVVQPRFFPGGDIGRLAVCGAVNDLAVMGAVPRWLTLALILEEGLPMADLDRVLDSVAAAATEAGVVVVTGDTKVVERGRGDGLYLATTGIGLLPDGLELGPQRIRPGDAVVVSGPIAEHGLAILACREGLGLASELRSDVAPLHGLCHDLAALGPALRFLRDPTRGGLAGVLADLVEDTGWSLEVAEDRIPVRATTRGAAELLGIDPLNVANEGKVVAVCAPELVPAVLAVCQAHAVARDAACIGQVVDRQPALAELQTAIGGRRIIARPQGEDLPRIC